MKQSKIILALFIGQMFWLFVPQTAFSQPEKLDIIEYTLPKGWAKTPKEGVTVYSYLLVEPALFLGDQRDRPDLTHGYRNAARWSIRK